MTDKRDAETELMIDVQKIIGADLPYEAVEMCRYIEFRENDVRREIADELAEIHKVSFCDALEYGQICQTCELIEKLRGNK